MHNSEKIKRLRQIIQDKELILNSLKNKPNKQSEINELIKEINELKENLQKAFDI